MTPEEYQKIRGMMRYRFGTSKSVAGMVIRGHEVSRGIQAMVLEAYRHRCSRASIGMWIHYLMGWSIRDSDCIVDSVICRCFKPDTEDDE